MTQELLVRSANTIFREIFNNIAASTHHLSANPSVGTVELVADGGMNAGTYSITLITFSGLINNASSYVININGGSAEFTWDGSNWILTGTNGGGGGNVNLTLGEIGKGFDNGASVISTGQAVGYTVCPYAGTITGWKLIGNISGSIVVDVWKAASGVIPTSANSIVASAPPTMTSAQQSNGNTLTGWTTSVAVGDVFAFSVTSATAVSHVDLALFVTKS